MSIRPLLLALAVPLALAAPASAEWLILRDGARLEIRGAARVDGRRILFTTLDGKLGVLRADTVDPAATAAANRPVETPASAPPAAATPAPVARLTDADFAHVDDVGHPTIAFYGTSWCPVVRRARAKLTDLGARFQEFDVDHDPEAAAAKEKLAPGIGVPVIAFGDIVLTGYSEKALTHLVTVWRRAEAAAAAAQAASRH